MRALDDVTSIIRIKVNGKFSDILIDSGANQSVIDYAHATKLNVQIQPPQSGTIRNLITADNAIVPTFGHVTLELEIQHLKIKHNFLVMKNCSSGIIIGMDFINRNKVDCPHASGYVTFRNNSASIPFIRKGHYIGIVYLAERVRINPVEEKVIPLWIRQK